MGEDDHGDAAQRQRLFKAFHEVTVGFSDLTGQFGVTMACPACLDVSALVNKAIDLNLEKVGADSVSAAEKEQAELMHKLQWLMVVHYVENIIEQFHTSNVPFDMVLFENKARAVDPSRAAIHSAVLEHLQKNTGTGVHIMPSPQSDAWAAYVDIKVPSMLFTEYPDSIESHYNTQCYATLWCLCHDAVPVVLFDHLENHNPRFRGYHLDPRALDTVDEELAATVHDLLKHGEAHDQLVLQDVAELHRLVPDTLNAAKIIALAGALAEADLSSAEERAIGALFMLQGLFTDALRLEDMAFRGVHLPQTTSTISDKCAKVVFKLHELLRLFPTHKDGHAPTAYDGKVLHTMLAYAHLPTDSGNATVASVASAFTVADEFAACADLFKQLKLGWLTGNLAIPVSPCTSEDATADPAQAAIEAWTSAKQEVQREVKEHADAAIAVHPVRQNELMSQLLLDEAKEEDPHSKDELALAKLQPSDNPWDDAKFKADRPLYVRFSNDDDEDEITEEERKAMSRQQQNRAFLEAVNAYIRLGRNRRLMHERDARPLLEEVMKKAPGKWKKRLEHCYKRSHWAGAVPICLKARRALDEARARQRLAAFQTAFAQTLLGQLKKMNLDPKGKTEHKIKDAQVIRVFENNIEPAKQALATVKDKLSELRDLAKTARSTRSEKKIGEWFQKQARLFQHNGKPVEEKLPNEDKAREIASKRRAHPKHQEVVKKFDDIGYLKQLNDVRAEAAVLELDIHMLRLGWHLEDESESNASKTESEGPVVKHRDTDPCVLSKTDHLLVPVVNCILDALEHLCDANEKLHESMLPLHKRVLGPMLQLGFTTDVENTLRLLREKYEVATTIEDLKTLRRFDIAENTLLNFQMRAMGPYLKRPEGQDDERSPFFKPDDWQVELLDAVDERRSALISAPTSSGKTFVSFYAMEKVLRAETDLDDPKQRAGAQDQIVVYVSPTKALVNQTVAEIEGRYEKKLSKGQILATAFTKEFGMEDYSKCRVLVTVPECLEHLLLLAGNDGWKKRIKWVILDEVHSISLNQGFFWERLLTLIDCPFLALSATIGDTEGFTAWLERLERERLARRGGDVERPLVKIRHHLRWNDLDSWCYDLEQGRMVTINPLGVLSPAKLAKDGFPSGCRLLPEHTHELWSIVSAILEQREGLTKESRDLLSSLNPSKWFVEKQPMLGDPSYHLSGRIRVKAYAEYEEHVKTTLATLAGTDHDLLRELSMETGERIDGPSSKMLADRDLQDGKKLLSFLRHMRNGPANRLPALLFHLNVGGIDRIQELLASALQREQDEHYYLVEVLKGNRRELDNVHAKHLHEAREKVDSYIHELRVQVQHIRDKEEREQKLQELVDAEVDRQLDLLWQDAYDRMNQHWKDQKTKEVRSKIQAELNDMVADGTIPRDPPALQEQEKNMVHAEMDRLSSERIRPFCLSDLPVSLEDMANAFPKANKQSLLRKIDEKLFYQALRRGIGIHYTELTKDKRQAVERLFRERRLAVVISTDTLALGISMPCRSVVFLGDNPALDSLNFHQMSGRAGRRGHDIRGHVIFYGISKHKIRRLLSSPLRQMFPNTPLDATTAIRAMARLQQAQKDNKEKEALGLRRLLLEPYAAQDAKRQEMLLVYMRAQLETLLNLNILTFDTNPELTKYLEEKEKERKRQAEEGEAAALADEEAAAQEEEEEAAGQEPADSWEDLVDDWESLAVDDEGEGGEVSDAGNSQPDQGDDVQEEQEAQEQQPADPNRPLEFAGPVVGSMGSLVSYLACHDPNNMWLAYMVRECILKPFLPSLSNGQEIGDVLLRNERLSLFQAVLASVPHERVHPTEVAHTRELFPEAPNAHLVEPPLPQELMDAAVRYRGSVLSTFTNILRLHGLAKAPAGANEGLPLSKAQVGGGKALPQGLADLKICDPLRLPTAAVSGDGFKYATVRELLLEIQRLPGLSVDVVPIPPCVDEREPHLRGAIYDVYRRFDLENLLAQAKILENAFYTEVADFHHYAKVIVEALRNRLPRSKASSESDSQAEGQEGEEGEEGEEATQEEPETQEVSDARRMVESLRFVVDDFYTSLERLGLIWT